MLRYPSLLSSRDQQSGNETIRYQCVAARCAEALRASDKKNPKKESGLCPRTVGGTQFPGIDHGKPEAFRTSGGIAACIILAAIALANPSSLGQFQHGSDRK